MSANSYDTTWYVPLDTDVMMEAESSISIYWPNFILEYDEDDDRQPPKQRSFFVYRSKVAKRKIEAEGVTEALGKSLIHVIIDGVDAQRRLVVTVVTDKPEGEIKAILELFKENLNAEDIKD
jgi:hypothetical protein